MLVWWVVVVVSTHTDPTIEPPHHPKNNKQVKSITLQLQYLNEIDLTSSPFILCIFDYFGNIVRYILKKFSFLLTDHRCYYKKTTQKQNIFNGNIHLCLYSNLQFTYNFPYIQTNPFHLCWIIFNQINI